VIEPQLESLTVRVPTTIDTVPDTTSTTDSL
jgi:hypothetical protein